MRWINIECAVRMREEFFASTPAERGTWAALVLYCGMLENGGRIPECTKWCDRRWLQSAGITKEAVGRDARLWKWDGHDLVVKFYPVEQEARLRMLRERSRDTAAPAK